ncbi:signal peptidase II [Streptococcus chenjunshii]|uniref:Lipoprotein signal peptidase n=1 Tax=Streptococcus chenjunshii TaxID=2173853 RepID=A0A372KJ17_9STRE|nr:signal peptidase II [Streptococcus chenjunshii]AXQ78869.1 signal peptidase II [Streptococcus chenjunshii]RFU50117.1 signal peptidase II [Streptococcus chenjunshii]RFU52269.1 signal peptidase II [Streptococcus chenjunshii]
MRKLLLILCGFFLLCLDQLSKYWIVRHLNHGETVPFWPGVFSLTYLRNYGAAFSILQNQRWLFAVITVAVLAFALYYLMSNIKGDLWLLAGLLLIIVGGLGNFIDRIRLGYVVDMINLEFIEFAVFNVADSYLTVGVFLLIIALWKDEKNGNYN